MFKVIKIMLTVTAIVMLMLVMIGYFIFKPSCDEVARVTSPNGKYDAVLFESNGGATTSFWYDIYIIEKGESAWFYDPVANLYGAVRSNQAYGVNLVWSDSQTLTIEYLNAKNETIFFEQTKVDTDVIKVKLANGIYDSESPSGGMLYNLSTRQPRANNSED